MTSAVAGVCPRMSHAYYHIGIVYILWVFLQGRPAIPASYHLSQKTPPVDGGQAGFFDRSIVPCCPIPFMDVEVVLWVDERPTLHHMIPMDLRDDGGECDGGFFLIPLDDGALFAPPRRSFESTIEEDHTVFRRDAQFSYRFTQSLPDRMRESACVNHSRRRGCDRPTHAILPCFMDSIAPFFACICRQLFGVLHSMEACEEVNRNRHRSDRHRTGQRATSHLIHSYDISEFRHIPIV